jgi:hypothetical protein
VPTRILEKEKGRRVPDMGSKEGAEEQSCPTAHSNQSRRQHCRGGEPNLQSVRFSRASSRIAVEYLNRNAGSQFRPWESIRNAQFH